LIHRPDAEPFFVDIVKQNVARYEAEGFCFASPRDLPPEEASARR
jgi:hypothetical protein